MDEDREKELKRLRTENEALKQRVRELEAPEVYRKRYGLGPANGIASEPTQGREI
jgi:BMFP domain-containing protein YqiC